MSVTGSHEIDMWNWRVKPVCKTKIGIRQIDLFSMNGVLCREYSLAAQASFWLLNLSLST